MQDFSSDFKTFIRLGCNRYNFIRNHLEKNGIKFSVIQIEDKKHIIVDFCSEYALNEQKKIFIAHYDRVPNTPGANDNSCAAFTLLNWTVSLSQKRITHNVKIIFTDGEEDGLKGVASQGAFKLARQLKKDGLSKEEIFVFDCMGRGTVPIICLTSLTNKSPLDFKKKLTVLEAKAENALAASCGLYMKLPTSFSDNAGFIANGIPAVAISMLPENEAKAYQSYIKKRLIQKKEELISGKNNSSISSQAESKGFYRPETWTLIHTMNDDVSTLTPESPLLMEKILNELLYL